VVNIPIPSILWAYKNQLLAGKHDENSFTPPKTNMEPENDGFYIIGISSSRGSFSGSMLVFRGVPAFSGDVFFVRGTLHACPKQFFTELDGVEILPPSTHQA